MKDVFSFQDYKFYIHFRVENAAGGSRGVKSAISQATNCQTAQLSRVLNGDAHFTLEQGEALNHYFAHTEDEAHYFMLLLHKQRAGTQSLKRYYDKQLEMAVNSRLSLKNRIQLKPHLTMEDQARYFSSWLYAAVHVLVSIPEFNDRDKIAAYLGVRHQQITPIVALLTATGLIEQSKNGLKVGATRMHVPSDSPLVSKHHTNWRLQAIRSLDRGESPGTQEDLHYSSVVSLSREDVTRLKALLVKTIEEFNGTVKDSGDECAQCLVIDFFKL